MAYPNFLGARMAATKLLLAQNLQNLRLDVTALTYKYDIRFDSLEHFCELTCKKVEDISQGSDCLRDGVTIKHQRAGKPLYIILYSNAQTNCGRRAFTLAHEVGHVYLGHKSDGDVQEIEANFFAAELLAPRIFVHELIRHCPNKLEAKELGRYFALSTAAASLRIKNATDYSYLAFYDEEKMLLERYGYLLPYLNNPSKAIVDF